ncbi:hypothetical protein [Lactococcus lactis]|uniref:Uncharacterized protein n=1 Tax=Lactococcus lactis TaxID=1358 RepID=A0AAP3Z328_9LACT|nr:hypothetical protein [Lactococcus lactis]MDG4977456.1 hypothetical protein [Lactococcus lactis]
MTVNERFPDYSKLISKSYPLRYFANRISYVTATVKWEVYIILWLNYNHLLALPEFLKEAVNVELNGQNYTKVLDDFHKSDNNYKK